MPLQRGCCEEPGSKSMFASRRTWLICTRTMHRQQLSQFRLLRSMVTSIWRTVRATMLSRTGPLSSCSRWISSMISSRTFCRPHIHVFSKTYHVCSRAMQQQQDVKLRHKQHVFGRRSLHKHVQGCCNIMHIMQARLLQKALAACTAGQLRAKRSACIQQDTSIHRKELSTDHLPALMKQQS